MIENLKGKDFKKELVLKGILISFAILFYFFIKNIPFALEKIRLFLNTMNPFIYGMVIAYSDYIYPNRYRMCYFEKMYGFRKYS